LTRLSKQYLLREQRTNTNEQAAQGKDEMSGADAIFCMVALLED
jgi:hypothetical protein